MLSQSLIRENIKKELSGLIILEFLILFDCNSYFDYTYFQSILYYFLNYSIIYSVIRLFILLTNFKYSRTPIVLRVTFIQIKFRF